MSAFDCPRSAVPCVRMPSSASGRSVRHPLSPNPWGSQPPRSDALGQRVPQGMPRPTPGTPSGSAPAAHVQGARSVVSMGTLIARIAAAARSDGEDGFGVRTLKVLDAVGGAGELDTVTEPLKRAVRGLPLGRVRSVLHGRPLGHPLHPALVQLPVGAWLSAAVLDLVPGSSAPHASSSRSALSPLLPRR